MVFTPSVIGSLMGGRPPDVPDEEVLSIFSTSKDPAFATTEIAEKLDFSQPGMYSRLEQLKEDGYLEGKIAGGTRIWWITEKGESFFQNSREK